MFGQLFKGFYDVKIVFKLNGYIVIVEKVIFEFFELGKFYESNVQMVYQDCMICVDFFCMFWYMQYGDLFIIILVLKVNNGIIILILCILY